jgi:DNA-binding FadR family transcriptional regulator
MQQTRPPKLKSLRRNKLLYQAVQEEIKSYILKHHLVPGDAIPTEHELAQQLDISRNSVREAVKSLEALGILESRAGSGLYVRSFSFDSILNNLPYGLLFDLKVLTDLVEVRMYMETGMMARVGEQVTPDQLAELQRVLDHMRVEAERGVYSEEDDRLFHQILYRNVNNEILSRILDIFWLALRQAQKAADIPPASPMEAYERHVLIAHSLSQRDVAALKEAMQLHYTGIRLRLERFKQSHSR